MMLKHDYSVNVVAEKNVDGDAVLTFRVKVENRTLEQALTQHLIEYWRWVAEGKVEYHSTYQSDRSAKKQFYYDRYHNNIDYDANDDTYTFSIQTEDGPEGDTWISGRFKLDGGKVAVLDKRASVC